MTVETQTVGAFGEKTVEAELLRLGWRTANFNSSITNAAEYDLIAVRGERMVQLRVKTCGRGVNAFQFSCPIGKELRTDVPANDYTILVRMGETRHDDRFYVLPTCDLRKQINIRRSEPRKDGKSRLELGLCTLRLRQHGSGSERVNYGFEEKWKSHLNDWKCLDGDSA